MIMNEINIVEHHTIIRETIGYDGLARIDVEDIPDVMKFLTIIHNYMKLKKLDAKS